ncbi:MAG: hypothetical protein VZR73_18610, partial [Acutalibacteraceae bacterium]|nr:hypothetical protein [Acutalibacteraceae bacterium]
GNIIQTDYFTSGTVNVYEGGYSNNQWNGEGKLTCAYQTGDYSKTIYEGKWTNNVLSGTIKETLYYTNEDVVVYQGGFIKNSWNGKAKLTISYKTGNIYQREMEGNYQDGTKIGTFHFTDYYQNGEVKQYDLKY